MSAETRPTPPGHTEPVPGVGTTRHFRWLRGIVAAVLVLNLVDALLTIAWVKGGLATEANPLMADAIESSPVLFVTVKTALVCAGSLLLWRRRRRPVAVIGIFVVFMAYYLLLLYHLRFAREWVVHWWQSA